MPVTLLPPYTTGIGAYEAEPLTEGPALLRTRGMSRWHRPRSGVRLPDGRVSYTVWCGQHVGGNLRTGGALAAEEPPPGEPVCGTCDGRAAGAGQIPSPPGRRLAFSPRWQTPPRWCPGSRSSVLFEALPGGRVGRCLACSDLLPLRAMGGPYNGGYGIVQHPPGPGLLTPCPFHAWRQFTAVDGRPCCACGRALTREDTP